ncbi:kanadaptin [Hyposmocoma kahamanoa]|uniref:kanadaptin n=1 Tax=Hyposmocoma kahamanoa TaxID=1477025 RepID=UPI000E6D6B9A|nr:kanadaptin [Hyposmocoma kahamanoa]
MEDPSTTESVENSGKDAEKVEFKKPVLIGRIGKLPKKAKTDQEKAAEEKIDVTPPEPTSESNAKSSLPPAVLLKELSTPIPYKEPKWSGLCPDGTNYALEVLKSGMIMETIELTKKAYYVFGRLANCDVVMAHPTISRHHAVLQYKAFAEENERPSGWYLYDLGSTHGTFLNKEQLKSSHYVRVRVGHQIKFGTSTRTFIVLGPDFDCEGESELSVTEIKKKALEMKLDRDRMIKEAAEQRERDRQEEEKKREEQGIDWGMGEDAEEEPDLSENPYASTGNEELYLTDPKKTLRGYCEREGHELKYDCEERGVGQFICRAELPLDDPHGRPVVAEVIHRGKKKDAVVQCALEACRILDRAGLLRQAKHESRRRKERDWSADDFYDSDDDTFLDRTGSVERKRTRRMQRHGAAERARPAQPLTYDLLLKQIAEIEAKISSEEKTLERLRSAHKPAQTEDSDLDALDEYMTSLGKQGQSMADKAEISKTKMSIQKLKSELSKTQRLAEIARPAHLPPLLKKDESKMAVKVTNSVVYGKRIKLKDDIARKPKVKKESKQEEEEFVEEIDSDEEDPQSTETQSPSEQNTKEQSTHLHSTKIQSPNKQNTEVQNPKGGTENTQQKTEQKKLYGPMRPPENYVIPENYFDQETDRDLPEIQEKDVE